MQKTSNKSDFSFQKITQISESHCGPAVVQMLLNNIGINSSQEEITTAAGVEKTIARNGMRIDHMVTSIATLDLKARLWYKARASIEDIRTLLEVHKFPVGVEWQGIFSKAQEINASTGHYSIVTRVDNTAQELIIVDPYKDYADQDRIIEKKVFLRRWWDDNTIQNPISHRTQNVHDDKVLFVLTPLSTSFPDDLRMIEGSQYNAPQDL